MIKIEVPELTKTEKQILYIFYKFRFLTVYHLMKILGHKSHTRIGEWLDDLVLKGCLERDEGQKYPKGPNIYHLTTVGRFALKRIKGVDKSTLKILNREHKKTKKFRKHWMFVADIHNNYLVLTVGDKLKFTTQTEMEADEFLLDPRPDAYISIEHNGQVLKRYFLQVFDENIPKRKVYERLQQYLDYWSEEQWQKQTKLPFPDVLVVFPDLTLKYKAFRFLKAVMSVNSYYDVTFHLSTKEQIKYHGVGKDSWQKVTPAIN